MQVPVLEFEDALSGSRSEIAQSLAIIDFLETAFPLVSGHASPSSRAAGSAPAIRGSLYPSDPLLRAASLEIAHMVASGTQPLQNLSTFTTIDALCKEMLPAPKALSSTEATAKAAGAAPPAGAPAAAISVGRAFAKRSLEEGLAAVEAKVKAFSTPAPSASSTLFFAIPGCGHPTVADACIVPQLFNARRFGVDVGRVCPTLVAVEACCAVHPWFTPAHPDTQPDAVPAPAVTAAAGTAAASEPPAPEKRAANEAKAAAPAKKSKRA